MIRLAHLMQFIENKYMELYQIDNYLNPQICDQIIKYSNNATNNFCTPVRYYDNGVKVTSFDSPPDYIDNINIKLHQLLNIPVIYGQSLQVLKYKTNMVSDFHHDLLDPFNPNDNSAYQVSGQITWTIVIYLNDVEFGGETYFRIPNIKIKPKKGKALIWNNLYRNGQPNYNTEHAGLPVNQGYKYVMTKMFKERPHILN